MMLETFRGLLSAAGHNELFVPSRSTDLAVIPKVEDVEVRESLENPHTPLDRIFQVDSTWSGKTVTEQGALQITAVWRCVNLIAGWLAKSPFNTFRKTGEGKEEAPDHYLWPLFHLRANPVLTAYRFKRLMQTWLLLWGNAYCEIEISGRGQIVGLWPWRPDRVRVWGDDPSRLYYTYTDFAGLETTLPGDFILHLRGLEVDGVMGIGPIKAARQSLGLSLAAEEYGARYFSQSGKPGGWIEHPLKLGPDARKNLRESVEDIHRGLRGAHRIGILEEGMKYHDVGVDPEDMQFLQTRQFQGIDIARLFGVPPHKIAELSRATFSNIAHQGIEFFQDCIGDWFANWEAECNASLLSARESSSVYLKFRADALMMGDQLSRYNAYAIGLNGGFLSPNDVRRSEDMNDIEGGDTYRVALNTVPLTGGTAEPGAPPIDEPVDDPAPPAPAKTKKGK